MTRRCFTTWCAVCILSLPLAWAFPAEADDGTADRTKAGPIEVLGAYIAAAETGDLTRMIELSQLRSEHETPEWKRSLASVASEAMKEDAAKLGYTDLGHFSLCPHVATLDTAITTLGLEYDLRAPSSEDGQAPAAVDTVEVVLVKRNAVWLVKRATFRRSSKAPDESRVCPEVRKQKQLTFNAALTAFLDALEANDVGAVASYSTISTKAERPPSERLSRARETRESLLGCGAIDGRFGDNHRFRRCPEMGKVDERITRLWVKYGFGSTDPKPSLPTIWIGSGWIELLRVDRHWFLASIG
ncbi:hypothetical protein ACFL59_03770 [Planctomycetota bacterium]